MRGTGRTVFSGNKIEDFQVEILGVLDNVGPKESLILDRWQSTPTALLRGLADPAVTPIEAALRVLDSELTSWTSWFARHPDPCCTCRRQPCSCPSLPARRD